jgi:hypothetical protein
MDKITLTRRAALAALAVFAVAPRAAGAGPAATLFREIRVDVSPLADKDEADYGSRIAAVLPGYLRQSFAKYLAPGNPGAAVLVARIDLVTIGPPFQRSNDAQPQSDTTDSINGAGVVLDGRGQAIATYPLFSAMTASSETNSPYQEDIIRRRVETLALSFAQWLPGQMGL